MPPVEPSEHGPIYDLAALLLALLVEGFSDADVTLPDRRYVVPGIVPAFDDPQLTVSVQRVTHGVPGTAIGRPVINCAPMRYVTLRAELIRCTPTLDEQGKPPTAEALEDSARELLHDLDVLERTAVRSRTELAGRGDAEAGRGVPIVVGPASPLGADGGIAGSRIDVDVPL